MLCTHVLLYIYTIPGSLVGVSALILVCTVLVHIDFTQIDNDLRDNFKYRWRLCCTVSRSSLVNFCQTE